MSHWLPPTQLIRSPPQKSSVRLTNFGIHVPGRRLLERPFAPGNELRLLIPAKEENQGGKTREIKKGQEKHSGFFFRPLIGCVSLSRWNRKRRRVEGKGRETVSFHPQKKKGLNGKVRDRLTLCLTKNKRRLARIGENKWEGPWNNMA